MKTADIAKLRTKIKRAIEILHRPVEYDLEADALLVQALALLPCETCSGTGILNRPDTFDSPIPCPDCQPKSKDNEGVCPDCGEYHPTSTICPPHEVRMK